MISEQEFTRRMWRTVLAVVAAGIGVAGLWAAREALILVYISALLAMGFSPLVRLIQRPRTPGARRGLPRLAAILTVYLAIVGAIVLVCLLVVPPLVAQATALWSRVPQHFNDFQRILVRYGVATHSVTLQEAVQNAPRGAGGNAVNTVLLALWGLVGGVFGLITIVILSFYFLIEAESLFQYAIRFVPSRHRGHVATAARDSVAKVSGWLRAQMSLAALMAMSAAIGLGALNVPYFYVVAMIAGIGEIIPIVGPIIAGIMAVGIALSVSPELAVTVAVFFFILHQLEANVLVPKIMEKRIGVSPVTVLIALLVGGALWGVVGAILAIPTAAILSVVIEEFSGGLSGPREREAGIGGV
jgi:predicted PurR-regulated permease PerM